MTIINRRKKKVDKYLEKKFKKKVQKFETIQADPFKIDNKI